jgi:hypothetical protein
MKGNIKMGKKKVFAFIIVAMGILFIRDYIEII